VDDDIVTTFHSSDALEIITKKIELDTRTIQLSKLMGEPLLRLTPITLQQRISQKPIWDATKNPTFWYHEGMLHSLAALETDLSQI
jgi:hypothetical protein